MACPLCKVPGEKFTEMVAGAALAAEHEYGVYAKTVKNNPDISEEDKKYIFENKGHIRFLNKLNLSEDVLQKIAYKNAEMIIRKSLIK